VTLSPQPASLLERELLEQGAVLARRAEPAAVAAAAAAAAIDRPDVAYLLIAARGSSDNAARFAQYALGSEARLSVALAAPSLFSDPESGPDLRGAAVLGISQSGQSPDIVNVLVAAGRQGRPTIALTNDPGSPLAAAAEAIVPLEAGLERSVAATKTYVASLHTIEQIAQCLRPDEERAGWLDRLPALVDRTLQQMLGRRSDFDALDDASVLTAVGRGLDFSTAFETALKIRELSGMVAEAFSPADLLHGPIAALCRGGALWMVDTRFEPGQSTAKLLQLAREREIQTVLVSRYTEPPATGAITIDLPADSPRWVAAILAILPGQVAALQVASRRGVDLDRPHGLSKITLTR
jgi:glucosamine--fructose-6-phosphate aminotransferase (isomerizing)